MGCNLIMVERREDGNDSLMDMMEMFEASKGVISFRSHIDSDCPNIKWLLMTHADQPDAIIECQLRYNTTFIDMITVRLGSFDMLTSIQKTWTELFGTKVRFIEI